MYSQRPLKRTSSAFAFCAGRDVSIWVYRVCSSWLKLLKLRNSVDQVNLAKNHGTAAVSLEAKRVHHFLWILAFLNALRVFFPEVGNWLSTAPASDRNYHGITCTTSALSPAPASACLALQALFCAHPQRATDDHRKGIAASASCLSYAGQALSR